MKLLFIIDKLNMGGVSSSLLNLLSYLENRVECDLLIFSGKVPEGVEIPNGVRLVEPSKALHLLGKSQREMGEEGIIRRCFRSFLAVCSKVFGGYYARKLLFKFVKQIEGYDVVVSYTHDVSYKSLTTGCNQFAAEKVKAKKRVAFVHCDYENYGGYHPKHWKTYKQFDYIACVSEGCKDSFLRCFPQAKDTAVVVENLTNVDRINRLLSDYKRYDPSLVEFVTVCRLAEEKGLFRALEAFSEALKENDAFHWTVVGDGEEKERLLTEIQARGLEEKISLVGETSNPFYYMKDADYFLLPSYHEAAPMVFGECIAVGLSIISTETISARQLVEERGFGIVCENSTEGICNAIKQAIRSSEERGKSIGDAGAVNAYAESSVVELLKKLQD